MLKRAGNPLLILRLGELPVLARALLERIATFKATTFEPPLGSGPYRISQVEPGRRLVFERVKDWWGEKLPVNRGKYNFDRVEVEFYRDSNVAFEAFKAGEFDFYIETPGEELGQRLPLPGHRPRRGDPRRDPRTRSPPRPRRCS